jgi:membrane protease YdiL (CAAX protease family)
VFLFLIMPSAVLSFLAAREGTLSFVLAAVATLLRDLGVVGLILFSCLAQLRTLGADWMNSQERLENTALSMALFVPVFRGARLLGGALQDGGLHASSTPLPSFLVARGPAEILLPFVLVVALAEETILRGYLTQRSRAITARPAAAALLAAAMSSLGHGYESTRRVTTVGAIGLVFALV